MVRSGCLVLAILVAGACGTTTDDRPATLANITESILKPTCAAAQCHSTFRQQNGYDFETVKTARASFQSDPVLVDVTDINTTTPPTLILNLTLEQGQGARRMPYDAPLPNADVDLIQRWLEAGLPGICPAGATSACLGAKLLPCLEDGAYDLAPRCSSGARSGMTCTTSLSCGAGHCSKTTTTPCTMKTECPQSPDPTMAESCVLNPCEIGVLCPSSQCSNGACQ